MKSILDLSFLICFVASLCGCTTQNEPNIPLHSGEAHSAVDNQSAYAEATDFILCKGADVSWLTQMEDAGVKFFFDNGTQGDCLAILKNKQINAIRLRVWVNPPTGYNNQQDVVAKAVRAKEAGLDVMIDFHYSDTWADPGAQTIPSQWAGLDIDGLCDDVSLHTETVLAALVEAGVSPKWVQVGNETGNGMLWPLGKADKYPQNYARLVNSGYDAVKKICPQAKVIIHLQNGQDASLFKWLFDILKTNGARWDVIGMSLYPEPDNYVSMLQSCKANMRSCIARYGKEVMLCEVGMGQSYETECYDFLNRCIGIADEIPDNKYLGVLYWEPQAYNDWNGYKKGAFTSQGRPGKQLDAFQQGNSSVPTITL